MQKIVNKGFNYSGCYNLNMLLVSKNFYLMDNHGAALWCWAKHIKKDSKYSFFHIDKHYDTQYINLSYWIDSLPDNFENLSIEDFFSLKHIIGKEEFQTIRYDNYIPIFHYLYSKNILSYNFFTHKFGSTGLKYFDNEVAYEYDSIILFEEIDSLIDEQEKTILNLDIDYFFVDSKTGYIQLYSDEALISLFEKIKKSIENNKIEVFTVALSPESCGSWRNSIVVYNKLAEVLNLNQFKI